MANLTGETTDPSVAGVFGQNTGVGARCGGRKRHG